MTCILFILGGPQILGAMTQSLVAWRPDALDSCTSATERKRVYWDLPHLNQNYIKQYPMYALTRVY